MDFLWLFEFCGKTSVLTMSSQDEIKEVQRKSALVVSLWWMERHYLEDGGIDVLLLDEDISSVQNTYFSSKGLCFMRMSQVLLVLYFFCPLD